MSDIESSFNSPNPPKAFQFPEGFVVPEEYKTADFSFKPLKSEYARVDYEAVVASIDIIRETRGGDSDGWPDPAITYEENKADLKGHYDQFQSKEAFAYAVRSPDGERYIGCFYLYPPGHRSEKSADADVDVNFWVTQKAYEEGLYNDLYHTICEFLAARWPSFKNVVFTNEVLPDSNNV